MAPYSGSCVSCPCLQGTLYSKIQQELSEGALWDALLVKNGTGREGAEIWGDLSDRMQGWCFTGPGWLIGSGVVAFSWPMPNAPHPHQHHPGHKRRQNATWARGTSTLRGLAAPGMHPEQCQCLAGVLCSALCAQAGQHVAARLRSETRTRHISETGISCHRKTFTYLCHFNALHSEPGLKKTQYTPPGFSEII